MSSNLILGLIAIGLIAILGRRLRFPFAEILGLATIGLLVWIGLVGERPILLSIASLVPLPLLGIRIPFISDNGDRRSEDAPQPGNNSESGNESARYVNGLLASRWSRGYLELNGDWIHFRTEDNDEIFKVQIRTISRIRLRTLGRAQLTLDIRDGPRHEIAFGRQGLARGDVRVAQTFWREAIESRQN